MPLRDYPIFPALAFVFLVALFSFASLAYAENVVWNKTIPGEVAICPAGRDLPTCPGVPGSIGFSNPNITVHYRVFVKDAETGSQIANGEAIPVGTKIELIFDDHMSSDIAWSATGGWFDTPYGEWGNPDVPPPMQCPAKYFVVRGANRYGPAPDIYTAFLVRPPAKTIANIDTSILDCTPLSGNKQSCIAVQAGTTPLEFRLADTSGKMYARVNQTPPYGDCLGTNDPMILKEGVSWPTADINRWWSEFMALPGGTTVFPIAAQTVPFTLNVTASDNPETHSPTTPATSAGQCTIGMPQTITMISTDPDNDALRYGVDWDADGSIDQFVPPTGYVPSGTSQSASRTYSTEGAKTVKVLAQDSNGLSSGWASVSFSCTAPQTAGQCTDSTDNDGDGLVDNNDPDCTTSGGTSEFTAVPPGSTPPPGIPSADLRLSVPSLVGRGKTARVVWSADNVSSCLPISGTNGDSFAQLSLGTSFFSPIGGKTSSPITARTTYTLSCVDLNGITRTKTASVNIQPNFRER